MINRWLTAWTHRMRAAVYYAASRLYIYTPRLSPDESSDLTGGGGGGGGAISRLAAAAAPPCPSSPSSSRARFMPPLPVCGCGGTVCERVWVCACTKKGEGLVGDNRRSSFDDVESLDISDGRRLRHGPRLSISTHRGEIEPPSIESQGGRIVFLGGRPRALDGRCGGVLP